MMRTEGKNVVLTQYVLVFPPLY